MKPRLLDLFCGAGGAGMGYARAGFEVDLLGMPWATLYEITQAIPPAYTEHLGRQLMGQL